MKTFIVSMLLALLPAFAYAGSSCGGKEHVTISCADGKIWDSATQTCVDSVSS